MFPPIPPWDALHPSVVHFPVGLLLAAPVLIVLGILMPGQKGWGRAALVIMALGVAGAFLAVATGEAGEEAAEAIPAAAGALERHEELAELARNLFLGLAVVYAGLLVAPRWIAPLRRPRVTTIFHAVFLVLYLGAALVLVNAAHEGGRLVHEFGFRAPIAAGATPTPAAPGRRDDD